ncbi:MAG: ribokinase, partial [Clostridia bacterium]|nr:ribokinase [Clostridia bacterium]
EIIPALPVKAVDTTAAGDAFTAALTLRYLQTGDMTAAVRYANAVGALTVSRAGASSSIPTKAEVEEFLK